MSESTAIAVREDSYSPSNIVALAQAAKEIGASYAALAGAPAVCGPAIFMACQLMKINAVEYGCTYHTINGKPTMRADAMLANFNRSGWSHEVVEASPKRACIAVWPTDKPDARKEYEMTRVQAEASRWPWVDWKNKEKGLKDNWGTDEDFENMMWCRLISKTVRKVKPEIVAGLYTPEEIGDVIEGEFKVVTAAPSKSAEELAREAAARSAQANALPAPAAPVEDEAEDADFEVSLGEQLDQDLAAKTAAHEARGGKPPITQKSMDKLLGLWAELAISDDKRDGMLKRRNAFMVADLSEEDACDIITKLESHKAQQSANPTQAAS